MSSVDSFSTGLFRRARAGTAARRRASRGRCTLRYATKLGYLLLLLFAAWMFVGEASVVPTPSMQNTVMVGDHLLWIKALYGPEIPVLHWRLPQLHHVRRGEIIAFRPPCDPSEIYLKRAVAIGGDRISIRDGVLWLNGIALRENYAVHSAPSNPPSPLEEMAQRTVPLGELFVLGDNRDHSSDSRDWGFVPERNVLGSPLMVLWSFDAPSSQWLKPGLPGQLHVYGSVFAHLWTRTR